MIPVYAICVGLGFLGAVTWVVLGLTTSTVVGSPARDPEERFGATGRAVVAGLLGFGMGGMSASFAGWGIGLALLGAVGGTVLAIAAARYLGFEEDTDGDAA